MAKMIQDAATGKFVGRAPDPDNDWKSEPLVWERAAPEETTATRPTPYRINPRATKLERRCECCGKTFDALERVPDNYKLAEKARYCSATCAKRAEVQRRRERERQRAADCLRPAKPPEAAPVGGAVGGYVCRQTLGGWVKRLKKEDVE